MSQAWICFLFIPVKFSWLWAASGPNEDALVIFHRQWVPDICLNVRVWLPKRVIPFSLLVTASRKTVILYIKEHMRVKEQALKVFAIHEASQFILPLEKTQGKTNVVGECLFSQTCNQWLKKSLCLKGSWHSSALPHPQHGICYK